MADQIIRKTFRFRLYPTKAQNALLTEQLSEGCRLYNACLQERRDAWRINRKSVNYYTQANQLKEIRANGDLTLANFSACQDVLRRVDKTFKAFFQRVKERKAKVGFPRFKSHTRFDSITFPSYGDGCKLIGSKLRLQGVGLLKVKLHRPVEGTIKTITVKREASKWYVCFSVECEAQSLPANSEAVGVDVGLSAFATLSTLSRSTLLVRKGKTPDLVILEGNRWRVPKPHYISYTTNLETSLFDGHGQGEACRVRHHQIPKPGKRGFGNVHQRRLRFLSPLPSKEHTPTSLIVPANGTVRVGICPQFVGGGDRQQPFPYCSFPTVFCTHESHQHSLPDTSLDALGNAPDWIDSDSASALAAFPYSLQRRHAYRRDGLLCLCVACTNYTKPHEDWQPYFISDGTEVGNPRWLREAQATLRKAQRKVARRKKGSHRRRKAILLLQKTHAHVRHQRADFHHKISRWLVNNYGLIAVEALNIKGLAGGMLAKSVNDAGWGMFLDKIADKAERAGRQFFRVNPSGTSQTCTCGAHTPKQLSQRWHECSACGLSAGRDHVSAQVILQRAPGFGVQVSSPIAG